MWNSANHDEMLDTVDTRPSIHRLLTIYVQFIGHYAVHAIWVKARL